MYFDRSQAELELEMNKKALPMYRWVIAESDASDGRRIYRPIKTCHFCGEELTPGHRC